MLIKPVAPLLFTTDGTAACGRNDEVVRLKKSDGGLNHGTRELAQVDHNLQKTSKRVAPPVSFNTELA